MVRGILFFKMAPKYVGNVIVTNDTKQLWQDLKNLMMLPDCRKP